MSTLSLQGPEGQLGLTGVAVSCSSVGITSPAINEDNFKLTSIYFLPQRAQVGILNVVKCGNLTYSDS